ncbi:MAG: glycosyltransferase [Candidatus Aminicenantes bacterium]|nr:glycosyltransferase [Candidatus Aminicenantes bacterium]
MRKLSDYSRIVDDSEIAGIYRKASNFYGRHIVNFNSTFQGGGVAEILYSLLPLMNDAGLYAEWRTLYGSPDFFMITKKFHNALQGDRINLTEVKRRLYIQASETFSVFNHLNHDCVIVHDPQPLPLVFFYRKKQPWIWRCHIDLSSPRPELWEFLKKFILRYDQVVISHEQYRKADLPVPQRVIPPAIDPLTPKNMDLGEDDVQKYLRKYGVPTDKPLLAQISRFDRHKDPEGVLRVFNKVRECADCRLVLCGSMASDDPEGIKVYEQIERKAGRLIEDKKVILLTVENNILVNALQRTASVIIQKSLKEGFGLTVTEALWKAKPVVASNAGGIPLQIQDGVSGFLLDAKDEDGFADRIVRILENKDLGRRLGAAGREIVRKNYLITRLLSDYMDLLADVMKKV